MQHSKKQSHIQFCLMELPRETREIHALIPWLHLKTFKHLVQIWCCNCSFVGLMSLHVNDINRSGCAVMLTTAVTPPDCACRQQVNNCMSDVILPLNHNTAQELFTTTDKGTSNKCNNYQGVKIPVTLKILLPNNYNQYFEQRAHIITCHFVAFHFAYVCDVIKNELL